MTRAEYAVLSKTIANKLSDKEIDKYSNEISALIREELLRVSLRMENKICAANLQATRQGHFVYEDYKEKQRRNRIEWIRYWITTAVSILALVISIIALKK